MVKFHDSADVFFEVEVLQDVILFLQLFPVVVVFKVDRTMGEAYEVFYRMIVIQITLSFRLLESR